MKLEVKERYGIEDLLSIMKVLRSEGGCPWDREQTSESIRNNFIEEAYEAVEAIDLKDDVSFCEELGDVLLQVVFHSRIKEEEDRFAFGDVCDGICRRLILRHPHIFGDVKADTSEQVLKNWEEIKVKEKGQETVTQTLHAVPKTFPALMRAEKVQKRAAKSGFDFTEVQQTLSCLKREIEELEEELQNSSSDGLEQELGDVLFSAVNVARFIGVDSENALSASTEKFISRFEQVEKLAEQKKINMKESSLEQLDVLWEEAKQIRSSQTMSVK